MGAAGRNVLFVFAHQDDEIALAARILMERRDGAAVYCVYLTNGAAQGTARERDLESLAALTRLGVSSETVFFIGSSESIADGRLPFECDRAFEALEHRVGEIEFDAIYSLDREGGHHDHDATHLVALAFAAKRRLLERTYFAPLYNGHWTVGTLFRAMHPLPPSRRWARRRIARREGLRIVALTKIYRSQTRTWLALRPGVFITLCCFAEEWLRAADCNGLLESPHEGRVWFERRFGVTFEEWCAAVQPFVERHLSDHSEPR